MPDPLLILKAMGVAAVVAAATLSAIALPRHPASSARCGAAWGIAIGLGFLAGCWMLGTTLRWPPKDALGRLLTIVLPLVIVVEAGITLLKISPRISWPIRAILTFASARILLHGSVYLVGSGDNSWSTVGILLNLGLATAVTIVSWMALERYANRRSNAVTPLLLSMTTVGAGIAIMLSGYATGGQLAMPLAAAIVAGTLVGWLGRVEFENSFGVGYFLMGCLLFVGKYFAELSTLHAILIATAPAWCWLMELPRFHNFQPWIRYSLAGIIVSLPLLIVVFSLQREFIDKSGPAKDSTESSISDYYK